MKRWMKLNAAGRLGLILVLIIVSLCLVSYFWLPMDPETMEPAHRFAAPSLTHWLGTDQFGRDVLSRIMIASRSALGVGLGAVSVGAGIGLALGSAAGMARAPLSALILRIMDGMMAFPGILLAMMLAAVLGKGLGSAVIAIGVFMVPFFTRLVYSLVLENRDTLMVKAARSYGSGPLTILSGYLLPAMLPRLITQFSAAVGGAILTESSLSFLGLGIQPPGASWGLMLSEARQFVMSYPAVAIAPGAVLLIAVLGFNLLGDCLNDQLIQGRTSR